MKSKIVLEEICKEDGCTKQNCFLKFMVLHNPLSDRQFMQMKILDKFKYEWSEELGYDIGFDGAMEKWVTDGYAKKYADEWNKGDSTHHLTAMYWALK